MVRSFTKVQSTDLLYQEGKGGSEEEEEENGKIMNNDIDNDEGVDIEELHNAALLRGSTTYIDPLTGFTVFTELAHLRRGKCCGSMCRHCPYGWSNVKTGNHGKEVVVRREAKVRSGDTVAIRKLLDRMSIEGGENSDLATETKAFVSSGVVHSRPNDEYPEEVSSNIESCRAGPIRSGLNSIRKTLNEVSNKVQGENEPVIRDYQPNGSALDSNQVSTTSSERKMTSSGGRKGGRYTTKNVPYTRSGDKGTSHLFTGERRSKDDIVFEAMGTVDELCSIVGTVHAELNAAQEREKKIESIYGELSEWLLDVMSRLFDVGSHVAKPAKNRCRPQVSDDEVHDAEEAGMDNTGKGDPLDKEGTFTSDGVGGGLDSAHIDQLEDWIDTLTDALPELTSFILPTGGKASAQLHVARCVCRRAERRVVPLVQDGVCDPNVLRYLNRLSDFFFTAARWTNYCEGREEIQYRRYNRGAKQRNRVTVNLRDK